LNYADHGGPPGSIFSSCELLPGALRKWSRYSVRGSFSRRSVTAIRGSALPSVEKACTANSEGRPNPTTTTRYVPSEGWLMITCTVKEVATSPVTALSIRSTNTTDPGISLTFLPVAGSSPVRAPRGSTTSNLALSITTVRLLRSPAALLRGGVSVPACVVSSPITSGAAPAASGRCCSPASGRCCSPAARHAIAAQPARTLNRRLVAPHRVRQGGNGSPSSGRWPFSLPSLGSKRYVVLRGTGFAAPTRHLSRCAAPACRDHATARAPGSRRWRASHSGKALASRSVAVARCTCLGHDLRHCEIRRALQRAKCRSDGRRRPGECLGILTARG